jgi:hypothetical protein
MYYRISFNTWLNASRKNQQKLNHAANPLEFPSAFSEEQEQAVKEVMIEVEEICEYTSEEEDPLEL